MLTCMMWSCLNACLFHVYRRLETEVKDLQQCLRESETTVTSLRREKQYVLYILYNYNYMHYYNHIVYNMYAYIPCMADMVLLIRICLTV